MKCKNNLSPIERYESAFPSALRGLIAQKGITQQKFGDTIGKSRSVVSSYINGTASPDFNTLVKIARFFDVSTDYLLGKTTYENPKTSNLTAEDLGLSETAANILAKENQQEDKARLIVLNYMIECPLFLDTLTAYFSSVPDSGGNAEKDSRLAFADIMEHLPRFKMDFCHG